MCTMQLNIRNSDFCPLILFLCCSRDPYNKLSLFFCKKIKTAWPLQCLLCGHNFALNANWVNFSEKDWKIVSFILT